MAPAVFAPDARRMHKEEARKVKKETREHIFYLLEEDLEEKKNKLDQALIEERDVKDELFEYKNSLLAIEDFSELIAGGKQVCAD